MKAIGIITLEDGRILNNPTAAIEYDLIEVNSDFHVYSVLFKGEGKIYYDAYLFQVSFVGEIQPIEFYEDDFKLNNPKFS